MINRPPCGIDRLLADTELLDSLVGKKVALLTNQSALTEDYQLSAKALQDKLGSALKAILSPEHGWSGLVGEGISVGNGFDPLLGLPVLSLYKPSWRGATSDEAIHLNVKKDGLPSPLQGLAMTSAGEDTDFDTIIIDLQDVGLRCYTYGLTCAKIIDAYTLQIIVCDRPNPLGPDKKGPVLDAQLKSFVGHFEIPFQHGQTLGQILKDYAKEGNLTVIPCEPFHKPYQYPWIPPSPNLPSWESVLLYPALVMLEGTNISEGRGTSLPFTSLGAPHLDHHKLVDFINQESSGVRARPITFTPQSGKLKDRECQGAHLILNDITRIDAYTLGLQLLQHLRENYADFEWTPVKSADNDTYFIDYLLGSKDIRKELSR
jgi:uncharacterized protein YbbC (DUF1343 family)